MDNLVSNSSNQPEKAFQHIKNFEINGVKTDLVCHKFEDKIFLIITQYDKICSIYSVKNQTFSDGFINPAQIYEIKQKFGCPSDETEAAIRFLMNFIKCRDEVIFSLGLKQVNKEVLKGIQEQLIKIPELN